jgi:hypothetical protein
VPANGRRGRPQGKCHREQTAGRPRPFGRIRQARVKRWGKSPPRERQRKRHGKPHREQDQIGAARRATGKAGFRAAARVGRARRSATGVPEEWPSIARKGEDRTRLTGRLTLSFRDDETKRSQLWCRAERLGRRPVDNSADREGACPARTAISRKYCRLAAESVRQDRSLCVSDNGWIFLALHLA